MISATLRGRLGNQMFIVATVIAHALKHNTNYCFPSQSGKRRQFNFMFPHLPIIDDFTWDTSYREPRFGTYNAIHSPVGNQLLQGYFQSAKYFNEYKKEVIEALALPIYPQRDAVGVHIRRGDYVDLSHKHPPITLGYLNKAIARFHSDLKLILFSDDPEWCRVNLSYIYDFELCEELDPKKAMMQLSACSHQIISNSSFSWWSAYLNKNPNKKIICPSAENWYGGRYRDILTTTDLIPSEWIQISY